MPASLRHTLFGAAFAIMDRSGLARLMAPLARGRGAILMFHHVRPWQPRPFAPNRLLEITPEFLDETLAIVRGEGFDIIPLAAVPQRLAEPGGAPFVALTFDDGYRDNALYAEPMLTRHRAPWTLFVTTDFAQGRGRLWWIELEEAVRRLGRIAVRRGDIEIDLPAATPAEKNAAYDTLYWRLRAGPEDVLLAVIADLCAQAGYDPSGLAAELCLTFDELAALAQKPGISIGAHTLSHPMLAKHDEDAVRRELSESRTLLEARFGHPIRHLAYPVGDPSVAGPREFRLARESGYEIAVTTRPGHVFASQADPLALPRVSINGFHQNARAVRMMLSGLPFLAWNLGRRLAGR